MALNVSLFAKDTDPTPHLRVGLSFAELVEAIGPPKSYPTKKSPGMYSPAEWLPGHTRGLQGIACVHFGVLDVDHFTQDATAALVGDLTNRGLAFYLVSTWSNGEKSTEDVCARLLVPFSRPVLVSEWPRFWRGFSEEITGRAADEKCKDASRAYYAPSFCEGRHIEPFAVANPAGAHVDVDAIMARAGAVFGGFGASASSSSPVGGTSLDRDTLKALGRKFVSSKNEHLKWVGELIGRIVKGEPYAREPGTLTGIFETGPLPEGRNDTTFKIICKICEHYPHVEPQQIVDLFKPSLLAMGGPEEHEVYAMVERQVAGAKQAHSALVFEAIGRHEPYTDAELQALADRAEISLSQLRRRWIVQKGKNYYFLRHDGYRCYGDTEAENAASRQLAPAIRAGVDTMKITQAGVRPKTIKELVYDYGTIARSVVVDLTAQRSYYDEHTETLVEAPCPIRVKPREHPDVAEWLRILAGPKYERLCQWLAVLPALEEPCAALYLEGDPGVGKSLLAFGVARMWTTEGLTVLKDTMGDFNDALANCPLVFADEKAPVDERGRVKTDELREFIQARVRPLRRKFKDVATIRGCARIVLAANNRNLLQTSEHLTEADIAAIVERIFYIHVGSASGAYLRMLKDTAPERLERWVKGDAIAEHALYLAQTLNVPRTSRFLVSGEASDLTNSLAVSTGLRSSVAHWLVGYLLNPERFHRGPKARLLLPLVRVNHGRFMVTSRAITEAWDDYVTQDGYRTPKPMEISKALAGLSKEITLYIGGKNQKFRHVNMELLAEWAEQTNYATREDLDEALKKIENGIVIVDPNLN